MRLIPLLGLLPLLSAAPAVAATADEPASSATSVVMPPGSHPYGKTYGGWSASWWQYMLSVPAATNPLLDQTGADCGAQQSGQVFYLGGAFDANGTVSVHRTQCHVPAGKALFFPIVNTFCPNLPDYFTAFCHDPMDQATDMSAEVDGKEIQGLGTGTTTRYRAEAHDFSFTTPPDNIIQHDGFTESGEAADGTYLMLTPLPPGSHTIHFHVNMPPWPLDLDVTYDLTVDA
jgi:hypothetical protein